MISDLTEYPLADTVTEMGKQIMTIDLGAQLRAAFTESGLSRFELARRASLSYAIIHRFAAGDRDIRLGTASKIAQVLGVELHPRRKE